eukprot:TRINITY_DN7771_c0_g1_i1.p1 TRINITY_DN7771_c0_g1~~TRINITY_DN7771_c0_g1_i1.p1  ORF type:complete len:152 (+),score=38.82 TRINITY_DN7771_c0_g1_i1:89-544(+)
MALRLCALLRASACRVGRPGLRAVVVRAAPAILPKDGCQPFLRSFSAQTAAASTDPSDLVKRKKRMLWRAKSRGWLELDVLMGTFVEKVIWDYGEDKLDLLEEVLELENPDLFKWFTGQAQVPEMLLTENEVMADMMKYVKSDHGSTFGAQ